MGLGLVFFVPRGPALQKGRASPSAPPLVSGHVLCHFVAIVEFPRAPSTFSEGVWGGFGGSKYLLRRYLEP